MLIRLFLASASLLLLPAYDTPALIYFLPGCTRTIPMKKLSLLIALALVVSVLVPFGLGYEIESRYRGLLAEFESAGYRLQEHNYERGFYASKARSTLNIPYSNMDGQPASLQFEIVSDIAHGPLTPELGWFGDLARFQTTFYHENKPVFPEQLNASIETRLMFSGDGRTTLAMPAFAEPLLLEDGVTRVSFHGLSGTIDFNVVKGTLGTDLHSEGLIVQEADKGNLAIGRISMVSEGARGIEDLMMGRGSFKIERISFAQPASAVDFDLENIEIAADSSESGETIGLTALYAVEKLRFGEMKFDNARLELELSSLNARALSQMQQSMQEMQQNLPADPQQQGLLIMAEMMKVLPTLLKDDPGFAIKTLQITTPEGMVKADFSMQSKGMTIVDLNDPVKLISKLNGAASVVVPELMVREMLTQSTRQELMAGLARNDSTQLSEEQINELVNMQVDIQISGFLEQNLIQRDGSNLRASASIRDSQVKVNGKPFAMPGI
jgi:uncharacterized protein YdgA (DUF945 family)